MIPYGKQHIDKDDIQAVLDVLTSDFLTQGPKTAEFEKELAAYCGAKFAVVFNSGTSALHGAYDSAGLKKGDELITSPMTFAATPNAALYLGATPVFCDIEPDTGNIAADKIERLITDQTRVIVPVHYAGLPCDMKRIRDVADKYGLKVVEDACHALGAEYASNRVGSCEFSDMAVFSFHPVKHIATGEGGAVITNDEAYYEKLVMFRNHGITKQMNRFENESSAPWYHEMQFLGFNYRMTDIQAALGISQLKKLDTFLERRRELASFYEYTFADNRYFDTPVLKTDRVSAYHLYPIRLKDIFLPYKEAVFNKLRENGLGIQVHYIPVYLHPYYQRLGYVKGDCPVAEQFYQSEISLPMFPDLSDREMNSVIEIAMDCCTEVLNGV